MQSYRALLMAAFSLKQCATTPDMQAVLLNDRNPFPLLFDLSNTTAGVSDIAQIFGRTKV